MVRGLRLISLLEIDGACSAGYFGTAEVGKGGNPLSLSTFICAGVSSGVTGMGRLIVEAVDGVSTASPLDLNNNPR